MMSGLNGAPHTMSDAERFFFPGAVFTEVGEATEREREHLLRLCQQLCHMTIS